jgi:uncharacterized protein
VRDVNSVDAASADAGPAQSSSGPRIGELDALRGFALGGILLVNIGQIMQMTGTVDGRKLPIPYALDLTAHQRFFPLFALLFGVGFGIFLQRAHASAEPPRLLLARRLAALAVLGAGHHWLQPGEALLPYALVGMVVLLPLSWAPRGANLAIGLAATVVPVALFGGTILLVPGLLLTGFALAQFGLPDALDRLRPHLLAVFLLAVAGSVAALLWQAQDPMGAGFTASSGVAGLTMAVAYATGLLLVLPTPVGRWFAPTMEALGRMALTNYLTATLLAVGFGTLLGLRESAAWPTMLGLAAAILALQALWSRWWLARFRYGPLEWTWRCVTWWRRVDPRPQA